MISQQAMFYWNHTTCFGSLSTSTGVYRLEINSQMQHILYRFSLNTCWILCCFIWNFQMNGQTYDFPIMKLFQAVALKRMKGLFIFQGPVYVISRHSKSCSQFSWSQTQQYCAAQFWMLFQVYTIQTMRTTLFLKDNIPCPSLLKRSISSPKKYRYICEVPCTIVQCDQAQL
jgi:hypothetical protein